MKKITCDRCGKDITSAYHKSLDIKFISKTSFQEGIALFTIPDKDFCLDCFKIVCENVRKVVDVKVTSPTLILNFETNYIQEIT